MHVFLLLVTNYEVFNFPKNLGASGGGSLFEEPFALLRPT